MGEVVDRELDELRGDLLDEARTFVGALDVLDEGRDVLLTVNSEELVRCGGGLEPIRNCEGLGNHLEG